jgi:hypothetical protein
MQPRDEKRVQGATRNMDESTGKEAAVALLRVAI